MENILSTMLLHKHVDGAYTRFDTMSRPLANNPMEKWLGVIRRGTYRSAPEDSRWSYEPVSDLWSDVEPNSDYSVDDSSGKGSKVQERLYDK